MLFVWQPQKDSQQPKNEWKQKAPHVTPKPMPKEYKQQDDKFHNWVMSHPTEVEVHPPTMAKHPPPTLRHLLIERVQAAREMAAEWVGELQSHQHDEDEQDEDFDDEVEDLEDFEEESEDSKYDWYGPSTGTEKPVPAPSLEPVQQKPVYQKGPPTFIPLNVGSKTGKGPRTEPQMRAPKGYATPITHTQVHQNPYRPHNYGAPRTDVQLLNAGWIPPTPPKAPLLPKDFYVPGTQFTVGPISREMQHITPMPWNMVPAPKPAGMNLGSQPQSAGGQPVGMPQPLTQQPPSSRVKSHRRHHHEEEEKETESDETESTSTSCRTSIKKGKKKQKRVHTVWLKIRGKKIPAKYRA